MRKINTVKELVDFAYNRYKTKKAITIESDYIKNINYFNFRFDIYSMARVIKSKENQIRNNKIAIISEFRYEFLVTYLANIMVNNTVILIDNKLSKNAIEKVNQDTAKRRGRPKKQTTNVEGGTEDGQEKQTKRRSNTKSA